MIHHRCVVAVAPPLSKASVLGGKVMLLWAFVPLLFLQPLGRSTPFTQL